MTEPMHGLKRFLIFLFFAIIFIILLPFLVLYSTGYKLGEGLSLVSTGGMYVYYPHSGALIYLDHDLAEETSLFERGIFIDDLYPKSYELEVVKDGYIPWKKTLEIKERMVTEAYPYLVPETSSTSSIPEIIKTDAGGIINPLYREVNNLFRLPTVATSTINISTSTAIIRKNTEILVEDGGIVAIWQGSKDALPFYFCDAVKMLCENKKKVIEGNIKKVEFYPGRKDVILFSMKDGLYVTELDTRNPQNTHKLLSGEIDFRVKDERVFIKERNKYYELLFSPKKALNSISI